MTIKRFNRLEALSFDDFIDKFKSSRFEYFGIVLHGPSGAIDTIGHRMIASGHQGEVRFYLSDIVCVVREFGAAGITMMHNHPHSSPSKLRPSRKDLRVTEFIHKALSTIGTSVLDHIIYGENDTTFSFVEHKVGRWGWETLEFHP